eukprot:484554_1
MASFLLIYMIFVARIYCKDLSPTTTNSTGEFYINSQFEENTYFQYDTISCTLSYCHIICDETYGCYGLTVNSASSTNTLIIDCTAKQSCYKANIIANIESNTNVYLNCINPSSISSDDSSCYGLQLDASHSLSTNINCNNYNCYNNSFYLDYTNSVSLSFNGSYASQYTNITANYISNGIDISCTGNYGCYNSIINANIGTQYLNLHCNNSYSCYQNTIYTQSITDYIFIECLNDYSCSNMIINA